jgi:protein-S-isoprenylcysteine O-methyltransferase Ste14
MQPLVGHDTLATGIFAFLFGGWVVFEFLLSMRLRLERNIKRRDRGSSALVFGSNIAAFFVMELIANNATWAGTGGPRWVVFGIGIALAVAGLGLRLYAIQVLGKFFTVTIGTRSDQRVVESGPYRLIRHPSYSGALIILFGAALTFTNWLSLLAIVPPFIGYAYRIAVEEAVLKNDLGDDYREYCRRTERLIPFVY